MKILHLPDSFMPFSLGGTEIYCLNMCRHFREQGHENLVVIHSPVKDTKENFEIEEQKVVILPKLKRENARLNWYGSIINDRNEIPDFLQVLNDFKPDKVIFHDRNGGASLTHLRIVKQHTNAKIGVVFHSPGQMCINRLLLRNLNSLCEIKMNARDCTSCKNIVMNKASKLKAETIAFSPKFKFNIPFFNKNFYSPTYLTQLYIDSTTEFFNEAGEVYFHAEWVKKHLLKNGVDEKKLIRWALYDILETKPIPPKPIDPKASINIALIGRPTFVKGIHLLIEALENFPQKYDIQVHLLGNGWEKSDYGKSLLNKIGNDKRYLKPKLIPNKDLKNYLKEIQICVIPSIWPETGPISVLDALEAGLNIIGARAAGIQELSEKFNFKTFEWNNSIDLKDKLIELIENKF